jgi:hypothetical protein
MIKQSTYLLILIILVTSASCSQKTYFISNSGNDRNAGTKLHPWKTLDRNKLAQLQAGDTLFFMGEETFETGFLFDSIVAGISGKPIVITSYGNVPAIIRPGNSYGLRVSNSAHLKIENLKFSGNGRKGGNTQSGVVISGCRNVTVSHIDIEGFQKSGLQVYASSDIVAGHIHAHDNGFAGIYVSGELKRKDTSKNIIIRDCKAENNPGDPTELHNHSGNGILVGYSAHVTVEYCTATNNGWDMPRVGNGPVGIWAHDSDSVLIQYCIAYRNRTPKGAADGGGFDLDGGMTNSIIQYCLSYENEGSGFGLFQYAGAGDWHSNTIRYCISENDGSLSAAQAGVFIWNASDDSLQLKDCRFHNNIVYNEKGAVISYEAQSRHSGFRFYNNIFVAKDDFILGVESSDLFVKNNWYSLSSSKQALKGIDNQTLNPYFKNPGGTTLTDPRQLPSFDAYRLPDDSKLKTLLEEEIKCF